MMQKYKLISAI